MSYKISVVVPIYNVENFLVRCVDSIINQTYKNLEIILVDDGSPDRCPEMCDKYREKDSRVRVLHKKNGGLSDARNAGIDVATGDYIMFVDSDDYIEQDLCETVINSVRDGYDIYAYHFRRFQSEIKGEPYFDSGEIKYFEGREIFDYYINRKYFTHMVCDKVFSRKLFTGVRFIKNRLAEDMAICYKLFGETNGAVYIGRTFYNYYVRENSIMGIATLKLCVDAYKGECEAYEYGNQMFPEFSHDNNIRLLNQSMKTYLKLQFKYKLKEDSEQLRIVKDNIDRVSKRNLPLSTRLFYALFLTNKSAAWCAHRILRLS